MGAWNIFRYGGDMLHLASIIILLYRIYRHKTCVGISLKAQQLYLLVFITRYLDLFFNFASLYNTFMKIVYLSSSGAIVYLMRTKYKHSYDKTHDTTREIFLIAPVFVAALIFNEEFKFFEVLWTFSIYLEAVAILPQLFLLQRTGDVESLTAHYIFALGAYRAFYLMNWIYRILTETGYRNWEVWVAGTVQTLLYLDFFYYYLKSVKSGAKLSLPR